MKKLGLSTFIFLFASVCMAQSPKYVFYFIGDGMGINHVNGVEMYHAELQGKTGTVPLCFTQFPQATVITTYSQSNGVTDSAAAGTALATGKKTKNGMIGMDADTVNVYSIAHFAKQKGMAVGLGTTVSINHATPASFYAHQPNRNLYYNISLELIPANFDFYSAADIQLESKYASKRDSIYNLLKKADYTMARGYDDYLLKADRAKKMVLFQKEGISTSVIPYMIDRNEEDMNLAQITKAGIDFLGKQKKEGFFFMIEGGRIDQAAHVNDAAAVMHEMEDFDEAVKVAYEFYKQHPDETLIVITADHETGGLILGNSSAYALNLQVLQHQKIGKDAFSDLLHEMKEESTSDITWEQMKEVLKDKFGLFDKIEVSEREESRFQSLFERTFAEHVTPIVDEVYRFMSRKALVGWASTNHSGSYVPLFAIGAGSEKFHGLMDNTQVPIIIKEVAGY